MLRAHIIRTAEYVSNQRERLICPGQLRNLGQTEIQEFHSKGAGSLKIRAKKNVAGLDIAVHDALRMRIIKTFKQGLENANGLSGLQSALPGKQLFQAFAFKKIHDKKWHASLVQIQIVDAHKSRVRQGGKRSGLGFEALPVLLIEKFGRQHFSSQQPVAAFLSHLVDGTHAAPPDQFNNLVALTKIAAGYKRSKRYLL